MEDVGHHPDGAVENEVNQLKLSHGMHHFNGCLRLLHLLKVLALVWGQVGQFLHTLILFIQVIVFRNIVLVQAVDVQANNENLLKAFPNDALRVVITRKRKVVGLKESLTRQICFDLTISVDGLQVSTRDVHGDN
jgi:hypothetical protein